MANEAQISYLAHYRKLWVSSSAAVPTWGLETQTQNQVSIWIIGKNLAVGVRLRNGLTLPCSQMSMKVSLPKNSLSHHTKTPHPWATITKILETSRDIFNWYISMPPFFFCLFWPILYVDMYCFYKSYDKSRRPLCPLSHATETISLNVFSWFFSLPF